MPRKNICRKICASLSGNFLVNRDTIYNAKYQYVLRGFLIEGTSSKATWRLHDFTFALFRTHKFLHTSNCREMYNVNGEFRAWFEGDDTTVVADALRTIQASGTLPDVMQGCSPAQYLDRYRVPDLADARPTGAFDLACAAGLCGDLAFARRGLESARNSRIELARLYGPYTDHEQFLHQVAERLEALDRGPSAFREALQQATMAAAAAHGFCAPSFEV